MDRLSWLGARASLAVAAGYLVTAGAYLFMPAALRGAGSPLAFWEALVEAPTAHLVVHGASTATGVFGLALVPAVLARVRAVDEGFALWASGLAWLGFAVMARSHLMEIEFDLRMIPAFPGMSAEQQATVPMIAGLALDVPHGLLTLGGVGFWVGVASVLGRRGAGVPRWLAAVGVAFAVCSGLAVVGFSLLLLPLVSLTVLLAGALLGPVWFVGVARWLAAPQIAPGPPIEPIPQEPGS